MTDGDIGQKTEVPMFQIFRIQTSSISFPLDAHSNGSSILWTSELYNFDTDITLIVT